ncbi:MAG: hypothetical protein K0R24_345 [Gammaproteobacteria bacterium]|jgi:conjugal transfer pilus assembly protein TraB|nr:hypothetical protein [Gammaproteobacteria bacterium]
MSDKTPLKNIKSAQIKNLIILVSVVIGVLILLISLLSSDKKANSPLQKIEKTDFSSPLDHVDEQSTILEKTQQQLEDSEKKTQVLQQQLDSLVNSSHTLLEENKKNDTEVKSRIEALEKEWSTVASQPLPLKRVSSEMAGSQAYQGYQLSSPPGSPNPADRIGEGIQEDKLSLSENSSQHETLLKTPDTYVPAGTFVKAVMIGGADASAAVNAQSNPTPMLFRLIERGTLPNHRKSHLKDCIVTAAVIGDISSERGMIRLESLSCAFPTNEVVDQPVEGTIFGSEGKNGVRGNPVWREGVLLQRAFAAGALSGFSNALSQTYTTNSVSTLGNVQTVNGGKMAQYGLANGAGKAMDKLADYNIQRADQYHPVIQLSAGTVVDVVFLKGFYLDGKKHESEQRVTTENGPSLFAVPNSDK